MSKGHASDETFPYSKNQLAHALSLLCKYPCLSEALRKLDEEEVPDGAKDNWHAEHDRRADDMFLLEIDQLQKSHPAEFPNPLELNTKDQQDLSDFKNA